MAEASKRVTIREATRDDAIEIAAIHIASWRTTYAGLLPAELIEERSDMVRRVAQWRRRLADPSRPTLLAQIDDVPCGFANFGPMPERPQDCAPLPDFAAYLDALYLLASVQGRGAGRALLAGAAIRLRAAGMPSLALHVLATNPARHFYEHLGAVWVRDEPVDADDPWVRSVYGWRDIAGL